MAAVPLERDEEKLAAIPVGMTGRLWVLSLWVQMTPLCSVRCACFTLYGVLVSTRPTTGRDWLVLSLRL
jgi:hypothetical protein